MAAYSLNSEGSKGRNYTEGGGFDAVELLIILFIFALLQ